MSKKQAFLIVAILTVGIGGYLFAVGPSGPSDGRLDAFAKCLAEKGAIMYGADWCPHCQREKRNFGTSFQYVPYVECPDDPDRCATAGVNGYPTWIYPDGRRYEGEQGLQRIAEQSRCPLTVTGESS